MTREKGIREMKASRNVKEEAAQRALLLAATACHLDAGKAERFGRPGLHLQRQLRLHQARVVPPHYLSGFRQGGKNMKPLKNIEQTAELLGISPWTVRSYVKQGKLHPVRIGRRVLLGEDELERFVGQNQEQAEVKPTTNDNELNPEERQ